MSPGFAILAVLVIAGAVAAMSLRNLVHCALALTVSFAGLAMVYLQLDAQFVGFAQILVYIGAVAILIVFAILLTRSSETGNQPIFSTGWIAGTLVSLAVLGVLTWGIARSSVIRLPAPPAPHATVREIGNTLMNEFILPLEVVGLLLTAAMIGAVIIALQEGKTEAANRVLRAEQDADRKESADAPPSTGSHPA